jgi:hypothetical protein
VRSLADCRQPIAFTNVILQDFLAKNLQINIIRNSFDALGVLTEKIFGNEVTQRTTEKKIESHRVYNSKNLCGSQFKTLLFSV